MKYETTPGLAEPTPGYDIVRRALATLSILALGVASALAVGTVFVYGAALLGAGVPILLLGWAASIGVVFALPFLVVRLVTAALSAFRL
ncbi:hypothetical protein ZOD2009_02325 [Haladaptatus paucihalophilus DX253]|uniref:Uncharacterized protein n=1 Tax=Haladaptatus paucihalophilus DX253 TaxID=797209 RepID=E7QNE7_HALPU|nr:hypothetical protein [Haladaptatus paucihalophilus]EFW93942.1 hypothetical protein ZOD2009_02325 [Haladaptatus paucihalophilus DX253]SHK66219.1 hypothetical protein SAMN05444342_2022 [Haladaptatus paucihalophilus DX253]